VQGAEKQRKWALRDCLCLRYKKLSRVMCGEGLGKMA
jgi:hypothetical protein